MTVAGFPREHYSTFSRFFSHIKVQQRGRAVLVFVFGVTGKAQRLSWQEEELPEWQEILLSQVFPN